MTTPSRHNSAPALDGYARQVANTWRRDNHDPANWRDNYADLIRDEFHELLSQHGVGYRLLDELERADGAETRMALIAEHKRQYEGVVEELGDLLWFSFRTADELGLDPKSLSSRALSSYSKTSHNFGSFNDIEEAVSQFSDFITVPSKWALKNPDSAKQDHYSLKGAPGYVLMRMVFRLGRALDGGRHDHLGPPSASMLEPVPELDQSIGDCINVAAYISRNLLGISTAEVCRRNIEKLERRAVEGKPFAD